MTEINYLTQNNNTFLNITIKNKHEEHTLPLICNLSSLNYLHV